jgi:hypothetical protein
MKGDQPCNWLLRILAKSHLAPPAGTETGFIRDGLLKSKLLHHTYTPWSYFQKKKEIKTSVLRGFFSSPLFFNLPGYLPG